MGPKTDPWGMPLFTSVRNDISPSTATFCLFIAKFNLDGNNVLESKKHLLNKICIGNYERYWLEEINRSPKAISYAIFKTTVYLEKYLILVKIQNIE